MDGMITDPESFMADAIYATLSAINQNTVTAYPPTVFSGGEGVDFPITIYSVTCDDTEMVHGVQRTTRITSKVDTFALSADSIKDMGAKIRADMLKVLFKCDVDKTDFGLPGGIVRRSQRFAGKLDHETGIVYAP